MFRFKQFAIEQDRTPMKVGTDGVLLGAWATVENAGKILDIGTGTGLIALMAAQRNPKANIDALEIEPNACQQAQANVFASPWASRIQIVPIALQDFQPSISYDSIICNPPFFKGSTKAPDSGRTLARHTDTLPHADLVANTARLLSPQGNFCVILPPTEALHLMEIARHYHLYPEHITLVLPNPGKQPKRYLIKFTRLQTKTTEDELIIELGRHQYSTRYFELTKDFYL